MEVERSSGPSCGPQCLYVSAQRPSDHHPNTPGGLCRGSKQRRNARWTGSPYGPSQVGTDPTNHQPPTIIHHPNHPTTELNTNKIGRQAGVFCGVRCAPLHGSRPRKSELPRVEAPIEELGFLATVGQQIKGNQIESAQCIVGCVVEDGCRVEDGSLGFRWTWALDLPGRRSIVSLVR